MGGFDDGMLRAEVACVIVGAEQGGQGFREFRRAVTPRLAAHSFGRRPGDARGDWSTVKQAGSPDRSVVPARKQGSPGPRRWGARLSPGLAGPGKLRMRSTAEGTVVIGAPPIRRYHSRMIKPGSPTVSAETIIGADADVIYALVSDITALAALASRPRRWNGSRVIRLAWFGVPGPQPQRIPPVVDDVHRHRRSRRQSVRIRREVRNRAGLRIGSSEISLPSPATAQSPRACGTRGRAGSKRIAKFATGVSDRSR